MRKQLRIIALLFALVMLLCACELEGGNDKESTPELIGDDTTLELDGGSGVTTADTTIEAETGEQTETSAAPDDEHIQIIENGKPNYDIIIPENPPQALSEQAVLLNKEIKNATGVSLTIKTDKYKPGEKPDSAVREILIGLTNRPASQRAQSQKATYGKKQYALVTLDGAKLVIYGSDSQMLGAAVIWFADNCVGNTANTGIGYFRLQKDLDHALLEDYLTPSYYISADRPSTVTLTHVMDIKSIGNHMVLQGACTDGEYAYVILENQKETPSVGIIRKIELATWKVVKDSKPLAIDHGNDICYNSKTGQLVVSHNAPDRTKVSFINPDTLELVETIKIGYEIYSITYNPELDRYALGISHGFNFVIVDSNFNYVGKKFHIGQVTGFTKQGMDSDEKYIYFVQSWENCIVVYDWEGNYIKTINFEDKIKHESEAIFHIGRSFYITFNINYNTYGALYRVDIS